VPAISIPIPTPTQARSRLANDSRRKAPPDVIADRRRELAEANIAAAIARALSTAPPLSDEQCARLAARLRGAS
jgi:hypothetical protein